MVSISRCPKVINNIKRLPLYIGTIKKQIFKWYIQQRQVYSFDTIKWFYDLIQMNGA
jgi:hypothetical protein